MGKPSDHRAAIDTALRGFRLMEYDWDGSGGLPLRADVADTVHDLFHSSCGAILPDAILVRLANPTISRSGNGTIEAAYADPDTDRQLSITFQCLGVVTYIKMFEDDQTSIEGTIRLDLEEDYCAADFDEIRDLFYWLAEE